MTNSEKIIEDLKASTEGVKIDSDELGKHLAQALQDYLIGAGLDKRLVSPYDIADAVTKMSSFAVSTMAISIVEQCELEKIDASLEGFFEHVHGMQSIAMTFVVTKALIAAEKKRRGIK